MKRCTSWVLYLATASSLVSAVFASDFDTINPVTNAFCRIIGRRDTNGSTLLPSEISSIGIRKLIYFRVRFPDDTSDPASADEVKETLEEANSIFARMSYGRFGLTWTITPVLNLSKDRTDYKDGGFYQFISDVREAGRAAGFNYMDFDLDVVRHSGVPGFNAGNANLGYRGAQVQAPGATILVHELGHNLGLMHANAWVTGSPGISRSSPPLPSNYEKYPEPRSLPVYPDSALGHESITGPGYSAEYGDGSDIMGSGTVEFGAVYRHLLEWLPDTEIVQITNGTRAVRIQGTDGTLVNPVLPRAIRVSGVVGTPLGEREYWIQIPPGEEESPLATGVQVRWSGVGLSNENSLLLSASAGSRGIGGDVLLQPGRTFSDQASDIHITVLEIGGEKLERWADVAVNRGHGSSNHPPSLDLTTNITSAKEDEPVVLNATATDPDGDAMAWHWDFGDGTTSLQPGKVSKSWRRAGDFLVSLELSDMNGGVARRHLAIRVGETKTYRVSGRVLTQDGVALPGVRVHNGVFEMKGTGESYASGITDSDGRYTLAGLVPGTYTNGAYRFGYSIARRPPLVLSGNDAEGIDFVATEIVKVSVAGVATDVSESSGMTNLFVFSRTGSLDRPLTVHYRLGGTATSGRDYARPLTDRVVIPAGQSAAALTVVLFEDDVLEPDETIQVSVDYPSQDERQESSGEPYTVYYPGWDLIEIGGNLTWILTDPSYLPGTSAVVTIRDASTTAQIVEARLASDGVVELIIGGRPSIPLVLESSIDLKQWTPVQTNVLSNATMLTVRIPRADQPHAFYRTTQ